MDFFQKRATLTLADDPRWDQVWNRHHKKNPSLEELLNTMGDLSLKRQGVLGSVWMEDLLFLDDLFQSLFQTSRLAAESGSKPVVIWVVPHSVEPENLKRIEKQLRTYLAALVLRSSDLIQRWQFLAPAKVTLVLVDQKGILAELYGQADWVWVGGGFGVGVHSTLEPAIYGVPIACGPKNAEFFSDLNELRSGGQLRLVQFREELLAWIQEFVIESTGQTEGEQVDFNLKYREQWKKALERKRGSSQKLVSWLEETFNKKLKKREELESGRL